MTPWIQSLRAALTGDAIAWLDTAVQRVASEGVACVPVLLPQLPRRLGRGALAGDTWHVGGARVDGSAWRACDVGALALLGDTGPSALDADLFAHGDLEERAMVLRSLGLRPLTDITVELLGEVQRTNTVTHVEAGVCDSNLAVRALQHSGFGIEDFNRLVLKLAFIDLPAARVFDVEQQANPELSRMLQALATEREAAGRSVWADTNWLIAHAPTQGTLARLVGHLEHGDDRQRLGAARGLARLHRQDLAPFVSERIEREPRAQIRKALQQALDQPNT